MFWSKIKKFGFVEAELFLYDFSTTGEYWNHEVVFMVKGISRQVIVVHAPEPKLFEQAIFILKDDAIGKDGVTDELLLQEAQKLIHSSGDGRKRKLYLYGPVWACIGAVLTGLIWLITTLA